jgi:cytochrome-b5 reductase
MAAQQPDFLIISAVVGLLLAIAVWFFNQSKKSKRPVALDSERWQEFPLIEIESISHDVKRFRFGLQSAEHKLGLPIGQHISFKYKDADGKDVQRSYTPTSSDDDLGHVDFVVKIYYKNVHPKFPDGGKMSQYLASMKIGDKLLMKGPKGHLEYLGKGKFTIQHKNEITTYKKKKIGMIAGGTGITPMLQVIRAVLKNADDLTEMWLIFANQSEEDILLRKELEAIDPKRLHLYYTVDRPPAQWSYGSGFINYAMCKTHLPAPGPDSMIFVCGPPPMIKFACEPAFKELGMGKDDWFSF